MKMTNQERVDEWMRFVFTETERTDAPERALRTAEEAIELTQAVGVDAATMHRLVDYVFERPVGDPAQEIAGILVTVYSMATAIGADAETVFHREMTRVHKSEVIDRCRRRQHEKREALASKPLINMSAAEIDVWRSAFAAAVAVPDIHWETQDALHDLARAFESAERAARAVRLFGGPSVDLTAHQMLTCAGAKIPR